MEVQNLKLGPYSSFVFLVQLLRSQFAHLSRLAFQNKKLVEQSNIVFGLFLGVFIFVSVYMNSSTDESSLRRRLVWFKAIFLKKNTRKLSEMCYLSIKRSGERAIRFCSLVKIMIVDRSFFTSEKRRMTNQLAFLARRDYFYLDAFWRVNLGMYIITSDTQWPI